MKNDNEKIYLTSGILFVLGLTLFNIQYYMRYGILNGLLITALSLILLSFLIHIAK